MRSAHQVINQIERTFFGHEEQDIARSFAVDAQKHGDDKRIGTADQFGYFFNRDDRNFWNEHIDFFVDNLRQSGGGIARADVADLAQSVELIRTQIEFINHFKTSRKAERLIGINNFFEVKHGNEPAVDIADTGKEFFHSPVGNGLFWVDEFGTNGKNFGDGVDEHPDL